jgi:hypothetical protein
VATVAEDNKTPAPVAELSPAVKTRAQMAKAAKEKAGPEKQEIPVTRPTDKEVLGLLTMHQMGLLRLKIAIFGAVMYLSGYDF